MSYVAPYYSLTWKDEDPDDLDSKIADFLYSIGIRPPFSYSAKGLIEEMDEIISNSFNDFDHSASDSYKSPTVSSNFLGLPGILIGLNGSDGNPGVEDPGVEDPGVEDPGVEDPVDDFTNEETAGSGIDTGYGFGDFLKGLLASQGAENKINRDFNAAEAVANREFQAREAQIQRQWYEQMSNSAYQRAVADMTKAGINPILAYAQGGAATSTTGIATGSAASYGVSGGDTISSLIQSVANLVSSISSASSSKYKTALSLLKGLI